MVLLILHNCAQQHERVKECIKITCLQCLLEIHELCQRMYKNNMFTMFQWRSKGGRWGRSAPGGKIEVIPKKFGKGRSVLRGRKYYEGLLNGHRWAKNREAQKKGRQKIFRV